jgi:hypothetical protein
MNIDDDFMEIGNTGMIPVGEGLVWDAVKNKLVDPHQIEDDKNEPEET